MLRLRCRHSLLHAEHLLHVVNVAREIAWLLVALLVLRVHGLMARRRSIDVNIYVRILCYLALVGRERFVL